jgi:hypothetical protein
MKRLAIILLVLGLCVVVPACPRLQSPDSGYNNVMVPPDSSKAKAVGIKQIEVLPNVGHEFILDLATGERIKGVLKVGTGKDAHERVVKLINQSARPEAYLYEYRKGDKVWIVDIKLCCDSKDVSLTSWLVQQGLAWKE